jgi:hypothetical protein
LSRRAAPALLVAPLMALTMWPATGVAQEASPMSRWQAGVDGVGPIRLGMSLAQAARAAGVQLVEQPGHNAQDWQACHYAFPSVHGELELGLGLMLEDGTVTRIDIATPDIATRSGAHVGDDEHAVLDQYQGRLQGKQDADGAHYLVVYPEQPRQLVFKAENGRISGYRVGQVPAVRYARGCA